jgi:hypothetical protein
MITPLVSSNVSHVGRIVNHRCLIIGFIIVIKSATIIYLLILIEIMIYQNVIIITEDRVKYVGEINYLIKSDSTKTFIVTIHLT